MTKAGVWLLKSKSVMQIKYTAILVSFIITSKVKVYLWGSKVHFNQVIKDNSTSEVFK